MSFIIAQVQIPTRTRKATKRGSKYPLADLVAGSTQALIVPLEEGDEIEKLQDQVAQFQPLAYAPPLGITAKAIIAEVEAARPAMTDAEAQESLRPSDKEAIRKASDFRKKMKAKVPIE